MNLMKKIANIMEPYGIDKKNYPKYFDSPNYKSRKKANMYHIIYLEKKISLINGANRISQEKGWEYNKEAVEELKNKLNKKIHLLYNNGEFNALLKLGKKYKIVEALLVFFENLNFHEYEDFIKPKNSLTKSYGYFVKKASKILKKIGSYEHTMLLAKLGDKKAIKRVIKNGGVENLNSLLNIFENQKTSYALFYTLKAINKKKNIYNELEFQTIERLALLGDKKAIKIVLKRYGEDQNRQKEFLEKAIMECHISAKPNLIEMYKNRYGL